MENIKKNQVTIDDVEYTFEDMTAEDWADCVARNKEHLSIQIAKGDYYAGYDLTPFENAVA